MFCNPVVIDCMFAGVVLEVIVVVVVVVESSNRESQGEVAQVAVFNILRLGKT